MKILWLTFKDGSHPKAGGAEVVNEELAKRLVADGHRVTFLVGGYEGGAETATKDGFQIVRMGNKFTLYYKAYRYYQKYFARQTSCTAFIPDLVIDEVNTVPFFAKFYAKQKNILFVHQLARQIWFYEMSFPLSLIGYIIEPLYLWLLRDRTVITVSESTKKDLVRIGFKPEFIHIISEGISLAPVADVAQVHKYTDPTVLAFGSIRPMKRTHEVVTAFEIAKLSEPRLKLVVAGKAEGAYGQQVLTQISSSPHKDSIEYLGSVSTEKKAELMQRCHVLAVTSVKEGWGLVVTEAASQGTPAVVYDVDGLRDSVRGPRLDTTRPQPWERGRENARFLVEEGSESSSVGKPWVSKVGRGSVVTEAASQGTPAVVYDVDGLRDAVHNNESGMVTSENTPSVLAETIVDLLSDDVHYHALQKAGWEWSREITFDKGYRQLVGIIQP